MLNKTIGLASILLVASSSVVSAQTTTSSIGDPARLSDGELRILTDLRLGIVKAALQLTPEQRQHWSGVEEAVTARAEARYKRMTSLEQRASEQQSVDPVQALRQRADALSQKALGLKTLADAWQPLYQSLNADQKARMRNLAVRALDRVRTGRDGRSVTVYDEEDDEG